MDEQLGVIVKIQRDSASTPSSSTPIRRYWAGGHNWSTGSRLHQFVENNEWQLGYSEETGTNVAQRLVELFKDIQVGDELAIKGCNMRYLRVYYLGRVREINPNTRVVKLEPLPERKLYAGARPIGDGAGNWTESLVEAKRPEDIALIFGVQTKVINVSAISKTSTEENLSKSNTLPLNTILYGPPGTGKTFTSVSKAVAVVDGTAPTNDDNYTIRFEELRAKGQIGFVTFHQSFSYEDFIEGLRPVIDDAEDGGARYIVRDGTFKEMALRALGECLEPAQTGYTTFEDVWQKLINQINTDAQPRKEYKGLDSASYHLFVKGNGDLRACNVTSGAGPYPVQRSYVEIVWNEERDTKQIKSTLVKKILNDRGYCGVIAAVFNALKEIEGSDGSVSGLVETVFIPIQAAQSYLEGSRDYKIKSDLSTVPRFVLIVDEINRGNISKIFGELITLLEADKRLGQANPLRVTLPYSGDTFALSPNLYMIGTMNTADKSLALLDVALRRRFAFEEMRPNFAVCVGLTSDMREVLQKLNQRIMRVLDREHRIGHAFFMDVRDKASFNKEFVERIVPLLQEYFYSDWQGLLSVLGEEEAGKIVVTLPKIDGVRDRNHYAWWYDLDDADITPDFLTLLCKNYGIDSVSSNAPISSLDTAKSATVTQTPST